MIGASTLPFPPNGQDSVDEFAELEKIVKLRDVIYADKHPRFKPPHSTSCHKVQNSTTIASPPKAVVENSRPLILPSPRVPRPIITDRAQSKVDSQISNVLLAKSDVLIKAENNLKRDRIEKGLKQQLENKILEDRLRSDGRNRDNEDGDLDVEDILVRAQALVRNFGYDLENAPANQSGKKKSIDDINSDVLSMDQSQFEYSSSKNMDRETDIGEQSVMGHDNHDIMDIDRTDDDLTRARLGNITETTQNKEKVLNTWPSLHSTIQDVPGRKRPRTPREQTSQKVSATQGQSSNTPTPVQLPISTSEGQRAPDLIREGPAPRSPLQSPRYPAIRAEEPIAPQLVRATTATMLAAPNLVIDLRDEPEERLRETVPIESRRSPYIKREPVTRPPSIMGTPRRSVSPDRHIIRVEAHPVRNSYYEYPEPPRYHYPHSFPPAHVHPAYDPYYRVPYAYPPPPPLDYGARAYGSVYSSPRYPIYDDYSRLYHHQPPHVVPMHPPPLPVLPPPRSPEALRVSSRVPERRPISPSIYRRRHGSRSLSPHRSLDGNPPLRPALERAPSRTPAIAPLTQKEYYERHPVAAPPGRYIDPYRPRFYVPYPPLERPVYYDDGYYAAEPRPLPPPPQFVGHPPHTPSAREIRESSTAPRAGTITSYRDREYFYPPPSPMAPPLRSYAPIEHRDYREIPRDTYRAKSARLEYPRVSEQDIVRSASVRPELNQHNVYPLPTQSLQATATVHRGVNTRPESPRILYRAEERAFMRGANEPERDHVYERAREADERREYVDNENQRQYGDREEQRRYSRGEGRREGYYVDQPSPRQ